MTIERPIDLNNLTTQSSPADGPGSTRRAHEAVHPEATLRYVELAMLGDEFDWQRAKHAVEALAALGWTPPATAPVSASLPPVDPTRAASLADAALGPHSGSQALGTALADARQLIDRQRIALAEAEREVEVTNSAARIVADERKRAVDRVAELEDELQRLRRVPEIGGARGTTVVIEQVTPSDASSVIGIINHAAAAQARRQGGNR